MTPYDRKRFECWIEYKDSGVLFGTPMQEIFDAAFDRGYELGKQETAPEGEEMLTCGKDMVQKLYDIAEEASAISGDKWYQGYMKAMIDLFGSKSKTLTRHCFNT